MNSDEALTLILDIIPVELTEDQRRGIAGVLEELSDMSFDRGMGQQQEADRFSRG